MSQLKFEDFGKVVPLSSAKKSKSLSEYKTKKMYCEVEKRTVTAYQIPLTDIATSDLNPARKNDCPGNNVEQIANNLLEAPQEHPIKLEYEYDRGLLVPVFGCNRIRASLKNFRNGFSIPQVEDGHIWSTIFTGTPAEKNEIQIKENFNCKLPGSPGTCEDLVMMLARRIDMGELSSDREEVKQFVKKVASSWAGRKFRGVWNRLQKESNSLSSTFKTWDKEEISIYWAKNNQLGYQLEFDSQGSPIPVESGTVWENNGIKYAVYFATQLAETVVNLPANATRKKYFKKGIDKIIVVFSFNAATSGTIADRTKAFYEQLEEWNDNVIHTFDQVLRVPQSGSELKKFHSSGRFAFFKDFS